MQTIVHVLRRRRVRHLDELAGYVSVNVGGGAEISELKRNVERAAAGTRSERIRAEVHLLIDSEANTHAIVSVMLSFIRDMPKSLISFEALTDAVDLKRFRASAGYATATLKDLLISDDKILKDSIDVTDEEKVMDGDMMRDSKRTDALSLSLLRCVMKFLAEIERDERNGIEASDLARCVGPSLCRPQQGAYMSLLHIGGLKTVRTTLTYLIENLDTIFPCEAEEEEESVKETKSTVSLQRCVVRSLEHLLRDTVRGLLFVSPSISSPNESKLDDDCDSKHETLIEKENIEESTDSAAARSTSCGRPPSHLRSNGDSKFQMKSCEKLREMVQMTYEQLRIEKREIKRSLQEFDRRFVQEHGRKPSKQDKESIRARYEHYNDIKLLISGIEQFDDNTDEAVERAKLEKRILQRALRRYEQNFEARHGRKVKYRRDISPVKGQYRRYKELKHALGARESNPDAKLNPGEI